MENKRMLILLKEHKKRDDAVFRFFKEISEETHCVVAKDSNGNDLISARVQMIIAFSLIDVLANYWYEYRDCSGQTNERAKSWYSTYCATDKNEYYKELWQELSCNNLYKLRNSLIHFFGLGERCEDTYICLCQNNLPEDKRQKWQKDFLAKGRKTFIIRPRDFSNMVREGAILMLKEWTGIVRNAQTDEKTKQEHIEGINRIWKKINKEGAVRVDN
ncbi:MAG: hypothetical protein U9R14_02930 [Patescibacteria group bacterium]|nr:hypothetical protein [Patescibacteria group bacterium]